MERDSHYGMCSALMAIFQSKHCPGRNMAHRVARANQGVDEARCDTIHKNIATPGNVHPLITQVYDTNYVFGKEVWDLRNDIWVTFHFGGPEARNTSYMTLPTHGRKYLEAAVQRYKAELQSTSPQHLLRLEVLIGMLMHLVFDSMSHQGFYGRRHPANSRHRIWDIFVPDIGHAEFGYLPDQVSKIWKNQKGQKIVNQERWLSLVKYLVGLLELGSIETNAVYLALSDKELPVLPKEKKLSEKKKREMTRGHLKNMMPEYKRIYRNFLLENLPDFKVFEPDSSEWRVFCIIGHAMMGASSPEQLLELVLDPA